MEGLFSRSQRSFAGLPITSGLFQLWLSFGIYTQKHFKYACTASLIAGILSCLASYFHMHLSWFTLKFKSSLQVLYVFFGLRSISWSGHQIHISNPISKILVSGIHPSLIPCPQDILTHRLFAAKGVSIFKTFLNHSTGSIWLGQVRGHHFSVGIVFI